MKFKRASSKKGGIVNEVFGNGSTGLVSRTVDPIKVAQKQITTEINMRPSKFICLAIFLLVLAGCSRPLPQDKLDYAGLWKNDHITLYISRNGRVRYAKHEGNTRTEINAPIKEFVGNSFEVGVGPFFTTFKVTKRPYQQDGKWKMEVDGQTLIKSERQEKRVAI